MKNLSGQGDFARQRMLYLGVQGEEGHLTQSAQRIVEITKMALE
jgi:hypothetical protein